MHALTPILVATFVAYVLAFQFQLDTLAKGKGSAVDNLNHSGPSDAKWMVRLGDSLGHAFGRSTGSAVGDPNRVIQVIWTGRLGDSLAQIARAILVAEAGGVRKVHLPPTSHGCWSEGTRRPGEGKGICGDISTILKLNADHEINGTTLAIEPRSQIEHRCLPSGRLLSRVNASDDAFEEFDFDVEERQPWTCRREARRVMRTYIRPRLLMPKDPFGSPEQELVVHMRGGDSMYETLPKAMLQAKQPPCSLYDKILQEFGYKAVRIITSGEVPGNPCVLELGKRHPNIKVTVQRSVLINDASALIYARHLVLSQSTFARYLSYLNTHAMVLYRIRYSGTDSETGLPCGEPGDPSVLEIEVPEMPGDAQPVPPDQRAEVMLRRYDLNKVQVYLCGSKV